MCGEKYYHTASDPSKISMNIDELLNSQLWSQTWLGPSFLAGDHCYAGIEQRASLLGDPTRLLNLEPSGQIFGGFRDSLCHDLIFYGYPCINECFPTFQHAQIERQRLCDQEADRTIWNRALCTQFLDSTRPTTQYTDPNLSCFESFSGRVVSSRNTFSSDTKALYCPDLTTLRHNAADTIQDTWDGDWSRNYVFTEQSEAKQQRNIRSTQRHAGARQVREDKTNIASSGSKQYVCLFTIQDGTEMRVCDKRFCRTEHLKRHRNTVHCERKQWLCRIPGCEKLFSRADNLRDHYWTHLDKGSGAGKNAKWSLEELGDMLMPEDTSAFLRLQTRLILYQRFNIDSSRRRVRPRHRRPS
jgi:hypothetical protein